MDEHLTGFNLVDDPWVPVRTAEGGGIASLREVLVNPQQFVALDADEVDEFFALLRLLTTVLNRAFEGPRTADDWAEIAYDDGYDVQAIEAYLGRWRHRFELFDPERPFLQYAGLAGNEHAPPSKLLPSLSSGNAVTLFSHASDGDVLSLTPAEAARGLVHVVLNGRGSIKGGEYGVFGARVAVVGGDLRETIVGNLPPYRGEGQDGIPVWERATARVLTARPREAPDVPRGLMDFATWQWRAVLLRRSDDGLVRSCVYGPGPRPAGEEPADPARWYDRPTQAERAKDPSLPLWRDHRLRPDRDVWREADVLVAALARSDTPGVLAWTVDHREADQFDVLVGGPITELKGSWVLTGMRSAVLSVPKALLRDDRLRDRVAAAVEHARAGASALRRAIYVLARELVRPGPGGEPPKRRADEAARRLQTEVRFWAALPAAFDDFLRGVAEVDTLDLWKARVDSEARRALDEAISGLADSPRGLRAGAAAQRDLSRGLLAAVPSAPAAQRQSGARS